jgi:hypothetical protein
MKVAGRVRLNPTANDQLGKLSLKRSEEGHPIASRTAIMADLIGKLAKRELDNNEL